MAVTFDSTLAGERDHIRLRLGDTNTSAAWLQDETIDAMLASYPFNEALAQLAMSLVATAGQEPSALDAEGGLKVEFRERIAAWKAIAKDARASSMSTEEPVRTGAAVGQPTAPDVSRLRW